MFLHVIAVDRQLTVFSRKGETLGQLTDRAFAFYKAQRTGDMGAVTASGRRLDLEKNPEANRLKDDELVIVRKVEEPAPEPPVPEVVAPPAPAERDTKKRRGKPVATTTPGPAAPAAKIDWAALRRGRDTR